MSHALCGCVHVSHWVYYLCVFVDVYIALHVCIVRVRQPLFLLNPSPSPTHPPLVLPLQVRKKEKLELPSATQLMLRPAL